MGPANTGIQGAFVPLPSFRDRRLSACLLAPAMRLFGHSAAVSSSGAYLLSSFIWNRENTMVMGMMPQTLKATH